MERRQAERLESEGQEMERREAAEAQHLEVEKQEAGRQMKQPAAHTNKPDLLRTEADVFGRPVYIYSIPYARPFASKFKL
jgi:hypothetical protein